jgi:putative phosphoesterase
MCIMLAILSDIHGNLPALQAVMRDALDRGCDKFISLGDVVSYYAQPGECIDLLKAHNAINILGNHDSYLVNDANCPRSRAVSLIIDHHKKIVTVPQLDWLKKSLLSLQQGKILFVHGGPTDPQDEYLYTVSSKIFPQGVDVLFSGHTHVQTLVDFDSKTYCNPGSVGQPRDGDNRAAYATMDGQKIELHRVIYDIDQTVAVMKKAGYEPFYYENLYKGSQIGGRFDQVRILK